MEKLLHRGKYVVKGEYKVINDAPVKGLKMLGMGKEFTLGDKVIYILSYGISPRLGHDGVRDINKKITPCDTITNLPP